MLTPRRQKLSTATMARGTRALSGCLSGGASAAVESRHIRLLQLIRLLLSDARNAALIL